MGEDNADYRVYVSRPQAVEAIQWTMGNFDQIKAVYGAKVRISLFRTFHGPDQLELLAGVDGAQGWVMVPPRHWLVNQASDLRDVWPVEDSYFRAKYELADQPSYGSDEA